jgi:hypothetical protein
MTLAGNKVFTRSFTTSVFLWGVRGTRGSEDAWVELRMPHRFEWPVERPQRRSRVKLTLKVYTDDGGQPQLCRFCDLKETEEEIDA